MRSQHKTRFVVGGVIAAAALLAGACSNATATTDPSGGGTGASKSTQPLKSILFVNPLPNYPAWKTIGDCMKAEAQKQGLTFTQTGPTGGNVDTTQMLTELQQGIADKVGAIVTFPVSAQQFDPVFAQARKAGTLVATVEGGQTKNQNVDVGTSFVQSGQLAAKTVAGKGGPQHIAFITEGSTGPDQTFVDSFKAAAKAHYPNITILDTRYDGGDVTKSVDLATALMTAHPDLNMIVTNEGADTPGIIAAIKQKNAVGKVFLTTNSIYSGSVDGMKDGIVYSFLLQNMCQIGSEPVDALLKISKGQPVTAEIPTQIAFATKDDEAGLTANGKLQ